MKKLFALLMFAAVGGGCFAAEAVANPKAIANKAASCIGCHGIPGYKATYPEVYPVPMIRGPTPQNILNKL